MGRLSQKNIGFVDSISIFWFTSVLSLGGLKFFVFNSIFNVTLAVLGCVIIAFNFKNIYLNVKSVLFISLFLFFYFLVFISFFYEFSNTDFTYILKVLSLVVYSLSAFLLSKNIAKNPLMLSLLLVFFGTLMSLLFLVKYIQPSGAGELSYLNLALPIGIGILSSIYCLLNSNNNNLFFKVIILISIAIQGIAILSLSARMVLISVAFLIIIIGMRNFSNKWAVVYTLVICALAYYFLNNTISQSEFLIFKIERLLDNYKEEPRFNVYVHSIELLLKNPFGYGLQSYNKLLGFYPHNIFIEIMMSSGFFAFLIFIILFFYTVFCSIKIFLNRDLYIYTIIFLYFSIQWSFSYDFSSSYALLSSLSIVSGIILNKVNEDESQRCYNNEKSG
ncbi:O-antigen ligase family protein [Aeromonas salmonicida]|uniref:O-antigen ligase family protein n=1 Tax=Aeromonas salmonicida TaxID=645 RepID=UPI00370D228B